MSILFAGQIPRPCQARRAPLARLGREIGQILEDKDDSVFTR